MADCDSSEQGGSQGKQWLPTTHWTDVLNAGKPGSEDSSRAIGELCQAYREPVRSYIQSRGFSFEDSEDLTHDFLIRLMDRGGLDRVSPKMGRFRDFLLAAVRNFLSNEWDRRRAAKRGGTHSHIPIAPCPEGPELGSDIPSTAPNPEQIFWKSWANTLLLTVLNKLESEYKDAKKELLFNALKGAIAIDDPLIPYVDLARQLGCTEGAIKVAVNRLRKQYRESLEQEIARTLECRDEVDDEIRFLLSALAT